MRVVQNYEYNLKIQQAEDFYLFSLSLPSISLYLYINKKYFIYYKQITIKNFVVKVCHMMTNFNLNYNFIQQIF